MFDNQIMMSISPMSSQKKKGGVGVGVGVGRRPLVPRSRGLEVPPKYLVPQVDYSGTDAHITGTCLYVHYESVSSSH